MKLMDSLGCSDHEIVEFEILKVVMKRELSKLETLDLRRGDFSLFRSFVGRIPWH